MINFIVVDSDIVSRKITRDIIVKNMMSNQIDFKIHEFLDYDEKLKEYLSNSQEYSIYVININLLSCNGIEICKYVRNIMNDWTSPLIVTNIDPKMYNNLMSKKLQVLDFIYKDNLNKNLYEDIDICMRILNYSLTYKYVYKNIEYNIPINKINYVQRDGRRTKIVTKNKTYYRNVTINEIKKIFPKHFIISAKGTLLNMKNVKEIDWKNMIVYFKDNTHNYVVTYSHKKEIESYKHI